MWLFARRGREVVYNVYDSGRGPENGWNGWKLLHPPPPPPPPPLACDPAAGRVTGHARLVGFGRSPRLAGRARRLDGAPLVSATISVSPRAAAGCGGATAGPDGLLPAAAARRPDAPPEDRGVGAGRGLAGLRGERGCARAPGSR